MEPYEKLYWAKFQEFGKKTANIALKLFYSIEYIGKENIPETGAAIIAPNHIRYTDGIIIGSSIKRTFFGMGKEELYFFPVVKDILNWTGIFPTARRSKYNKLKDKYRNETISRYLLSERQFNYKEYFPKESIDEILSDIQSKLHYDNISIKTLKSTEIAKYLLINGLMLLIHPEGTRHGDAVIRECKPGIAKITLDLYQKYSIKTKIIPCTIRYSQGFKPKIKVNFGFEVNYNDKTTISELTYNLEETLKKQYSSL